MVELLLVVFLIAILSTVAISSYSNSTDTFKFLNGYKQVLSTLRTARSYAVNNKQAEENTPKYYGVCLSQDRAIVFKDVGDKELKMDLSADDLEELDSLGFGVGGCNQAAECPDGVCPVPAADAKYDSVILHKNFRFDENGYLLRALNAKAIPEEITMPVYLFYTTGKGDLEIFDGNGVKVEKNVNKSINMEFSEQDGDLKKYIHILQVAGLAEEISEL